MMAAAGFMPASLPPFRGACDVRRRDPRAPGSPADLQMRALWGPARRRVAGVAGAAGGAGCHAASWGARATYAPAVADVVARTLVSGRRGDPRFPSGGGLGHCAALCHATPRRGAAAARARGVAIGARTSRAAAAPCSRARTGVGRAGRRPTPLARLDGGLGDAPPRVRVPASAAATGRGCRRWRARAGEGGWRLLGWQRVYLCAESVTANQPACAPTR